MYRKNKEPKNHCTKHGGAVIAVKSELNHDQVYLDEKTSETLFRSVCQQYQLLRFSAVVATRFPKSSTSGPKNSFESFLTNVSDHIETSNDQNVFFELKNLLETE